MAVVVFLQIYFGALVAGLRAGRVFNTWPEIDGAFIPSAARLFFEQPWWRNFFDNMLTVQFTHRMLAYLLLAHDALASRARDLRSRRCARGQRRAADRGRDGAAGGAGDLDAAERVPIDLALAHQAGAIVVLTLVLLQAERVNRPSVEQGVATATPMVAVSGGRR